jgi:hypothetical protein
MHYKSATKIASKVTHTLAGLVAQTTAATHLVARTMPAEGTTQHCSRLYVRNAGKMCNPKKKTQNFMEALARKRQRLTKTRANFWQTDFGSTSCRRTPRDHWSAAITFRPVTTLGQCRACQTPRPHFCCDDTFLEREAIGVSHKEP